MGVALRAVQRAGERGADPGIAHAGSQLAVCEGIPGAGHVLLEASAHLANICRPDAFAAAVRGHLEARS